MVSYKARNTLILSSFIFMILLFDGYYLLYSYPSQINQVSTDIERLQKQIKSLEGIENQFQQLQEVIKQKRKKLAGLDKKIIAQVSPAQTYDYFNQILSHIGFLEFNLLYGGSNNTDKYGYNIYHIKGEGSFNKIFRFVWYLERGPEIYRIKKLHLHSVESKDTKTQVTKLIIPFEMEVWACFSDFNDLPKIHRTLKHVWPPKVTNPLYPYIMSNIPANIRNLLEVERAELKAIVPGKAMVADFNGKIHVLREGDAVYLGYLTKIDQEKSQVIFSLNKGGLYEKFILKIRFDESTN